MLGRLAGLLLLTVAGTNALSSAVCRFRGAGVSGEIRMSGDNAQIWMEGEVFGLTPGPHGFHVHTSGNMTDHCKAAGGHFNPHGKTHGAPTAGVRHVGDLGNVHTDRFGHTKIRVNDRQALLEGPHTIIGRAIVIHTGQDDMGLGGDDGSVATGNAGSRAACCLVQKTVQAARPAPFFSIKTIMGMIFDGK